MDTTYHHQNLIQIPFKDEQSIGALHPMVIIISYYRRMMNLSDKLSYLHQTSLFNSLKEMFLF